MRRALATAMIVLMLALAGCGAKGAEPSKSGNTDAAKSSAAKGASTKGGSKVGKTDASKLLTPADVEKITGMTGLTTVPKDPSKGAGGDVNIATADGKLVVMLSYGVGDFYEMSKSGPNFAHDESGIGDEAYAGPSKDIMPNEYVLGVRSGENGMVYASFLEVAQGGKPILTIDQLKELAQVAIDRL